MKKIIIAFAVISGVLILSGTASAFTEGASNNFFGTSAGAVIGGSVASAFGTLAWQTSQAII